MRRFSMGFVIALVVVLMGSMAWAQGDERTDPPAPAPTPAPSPTPAPVPEKPAPAVEAEVPVYTAMTDKIEPGWFLLMSRIGTGSVGGGGSFTFDTVPRGEDEETKFNLEGGRYVSGGVDAVFFPGQSRRFLLSAGLAGQHGYTAMVFDEDEYGRQIGLDNRVLDYDLSWLTVGIGYRWLRGESWQNAWTFYGRLGFGGAEGIIDGLMVEQGSSGMAELGANWYHRYRGGASVGIEVDLRGFGAAWNDVEFDRLNTNGDLSLGGGTFLVSLILGWENGKN